MGVIDRRVFILESGIQRGKNKVKVGKFIEMDAFSKDIGKRENYMVKED